MQLTHWYICRTIALATVLGSLGHRLDEWLAPEARSTLALLGPEPAGGGWLAYMRRLIGRQRAEEENKS